MKASTRRRSIAALTIGLTALLGISEATAAVGPIGNYTPLVTYRYKSVKERDFYVGSPTTSDPRYMSADRVGLVSKVKFTNSKPLNVCATLGGDRYADVSSRQNACTSGTFVGHVGYVSDFQTTEYSKALRRCTQTEGRGGKDQYEIVESGSNSCNGGDKGKIIGWVKKAVK